MRLLFLTVALFCAKPASNGQNMAAGSPSGAFAQQLDSITQDFKNGFINIIDVEHQNITEDGIILYASKIALEGSYQSLYFDDVNTGTTAFRAAFPGDASPKVALVAYQNLVKQVAMVKLQCCILSMNEEYKDGNTRSQTFGLSDGKGDLNSIFNILVIEVTMEHVEGIDAAGETVTVWEPVVYVFPR